MTRRYTRHSPHCPEGFASTVELARETGLDCDRVRRIARRNGLLVQVINGHRQVKALDVYIM
jgi:hypothetical protein